MKNHAATSDEVELCGVLVGDICRDDQGVYLSVTGAIEGEGANTYGTQVTFTQQTWDHIHQVRERDYPNAQIVGWFHTHPGFGVFLSGMDTFIHENFFNAPHQIAVVLETKTKEEGCFGWVNGEITPLQRYWVGDREVRLSTGEAEPFDDGKRSMDDSGQKPAAPSVSVPQEEAQQAPPFGVVGLLVIAVLCSAFGVYWGYSLSRKVMFQALQTEFYSLMEFASINSAAGQDLQEVQQEVAAVRQDAAKAGDTEQAGKLERIEQLLAGYEKDYLHRDRDLFRKRLAKLASTRQTLGESVDDTKRLAYELRMNIVDLYMMRVQDILRQANATTVDQLSKENAFIVRRLIERVLKLEPGYKDVLAKMAPDLLRSLYPSAPGQKAPEATGKKEN
jgi:proteasome lid subunit RPN8/RPN11